MTESEKAKKTGWIGKFIFGIIIIAVIYHVYTNETEKHRSAAIPTGTKAAHLQEEQVQPKRVVAEFKVGETFSLGKFSYAIHEVKKRRCVGSRYIKHCAQDRATLVVVDYSIRNDGKKTETIMADDFELHDEQGRVFQPSSRANTSLAASDPSKDYIISQVQPGLLVSTKTIFEIPLDAWENGPRLRIPEKGLLGTGEAWVNLK